MGNYPSPCGGDKLGFKIGPKDDKLKPTSNCLCGHASDGVL